MDHPHDLFYLITHTMLLLDDTFFIICFDSKWLTDILIQLVEHVSSTWDLLFTIHSHNPNFNAKEAFLPTPSPRCSSKSEAIVSVLSRRFYPRLGNLSRQGGTAKSFIILSSRHRCKVKRRNFRIPRSLPLSQSCLSSTRAHARFYARAHPSIHFSLSASDWHEKMFLPRRDSNRGPPAP